MPVVEALQRRISSRQDIAYPHRKAWSRHAPADVVQAGSWDSGSSGWEAWVRYLRRRTAPTALEWPPGVPSSARRPPLLWGTEQVPLPVPTVELIRALQARCTTRRSNAADGRRLQQWLAALPQVPHEPALALECLAWAAALPALALSVPPETWWAAIGALARATGQARDLPPTAWLCRQWLAVELPATLAYWLPELRFAAVEAERRTQPGDAAAILGGEALPAAADAAQVRPLLASLVRTAALCDRTPNDALGPRPQDVTALWTAALRLARPDGRQVFSTHVASPAAHDWLLPWWSREPATARAAQALWGKRAGAPRATSAGELLPGSALAEDNAVAVLRSGWGAGELLLAVDFAAPDLPVELHCGRAAVLSGSWLPDVRCGGRRLDPAGDWECVCWFTDEDGDYLELEMPLSGGVRIQRQFYLARRDRFLYVADALLNSQPTTWEYVARLPLASGVTGQGETETREARLQHSRSVAGPRTAARVFPLALGEWRVDRAGGDLECIEHQLQLRLRGPGRALYVPLWFDLDARRSNRPLTWRRLTVAERLQIVPSDVAVGYRVQVGRQQWVAYRSLAHRCDRTVLGAHVVSEFLLGRFMPCGEVEPLVEVE
jgi:hypothetical protein